jgi:hypothetical protein
MGLGLWCGPLLLSQFHTCTEGHHEGPSMAGPMMDECGSAAVLGRLTSDMAASSAIVVVYLPWW